MSYYGSSTLKTIMRLTCVLVVVCLFLLNAEKSYGQHFDFGYEYGYSSYFGDLAPYSAIPSGSSSAASKGYYFGYGNRWGTLFANYTTTEISAYDMEAPDVGRQKRNLSFRSPILEYGVTAEINLWGLVRNDYTRIRPVLITGLNLFYFSPQALYNNEWINLQPLGTEGQGSEAFPDRKKYNLKQVSIPMGAGIKIDLTDHIWFGTGIKARLTFTDYLDDVSTTYVDQETLIQQNGALAAELAFRSDEINASTGYPSSNTLRGNPDENDWYMTTYVTLGMRFKQDKRRKRYRRKRHSLKCPSF